MGLDFYIGKSGDLDDDDGTYEGEYAHWSYGGFANFRWIVANEVGIDLLRMDGYTDGKGLTWDSAHPLTPLLSHSDCDGELTPEECAQVAPELRQIVAFMYDTNHFQQGLHLVEMMEHCARTGERIVFC